VRPEYQRNGLAKTILQTGMKMLFDRGAKTVSLGASSENIPMQRLAESAGFRLSSEKIWFRKKL